MKTKLVHRPSGLRLSYEDNLEGQKQIFIDLSGNSYTSIDPNLKSVESLEEFFEDALSMLYHWQMDYAARKDKK